VDCHADETLPGESKPAVAKTTSTTTDAAAAWRASTRFQPGRHMLPACVVMEASMVR
jgi:hypothetical protein